MSEVICKINVLDRITDFWNDRMTNDKITDRTKTIYTRSSISRA